MPDFSVAVDRQSIVVSKPSAGLSVTYRKQGRVLVAPELWRTKPSAEELNFYVRAWKAACAKRSHSAGFIERACAAVCVFRALPGLAG